MSERLDDLAPNPRPHEDEETFVWQAVLAIAQGRAANPNAYGTGNDAPEASSDFAIDCVSKAMALWTEYMDQMEPV